MSKVPKTGLLLLAPLHALELTSKELDQHL